MMLTANPYEPLAISYLSSLLVEVLMVVVACLLVVVVRFVLELVDKLDPRCWVRSWHPPKLVVCWV